MAGAVRKHDNSAAGTGDWLGSFLWAAMAGNASSPRWSYDSPIKCEKTLTGVTITSFYEPSSC